MVPRGVWWSVAAAAGRGLGSRGHWRGVFGGSGKTKEERREERQEIVEDITRGYFGDFHEFRKTGGKRFEAADHLCSKGESVFFPRLPGRTLAGANVDVSELIGGRVGLVVLAFRAMGTMMSKLYRDPFVEEFGQNPHTCVVEVSVVDKLVYRMLRGWIARTLRKDIPVERHPWFVVHTGGDVVELKEGLSVGNVIVPHVYLVDQEGCVRWRAHATPTTRELSAMLKCTRQLVDSQR